MPTLQEPSPHLAREAIMFTLIISYIRSCYISLYHIILLLLLLLSLLIRIFCRALSSADRARVRVSQVQQQVPFICSIVISTIKWFLDVV